MLIFSNKCGKIQLSGENSMIITTEQLIYNYNKFADPKGKIERDIRNGRLFRVVRGLYETDPNVQGVKLAQFIYGPSYLSFDYVLSLRGLIPETVYNTFTCATYDKRKVKLYKNKFGNYIYRDVPSKVFSLGVQTIKDENYSYQMASVEKALCDKLYIVPPIKSIKGLKVLLFEDLRVDKSDFNKLDKQEILKIAPLYHSTTLNVFIKFLQGENNNE